MNMIQQFLHLEHSEDEVFAATLGKTVRQMEKALPFKQIVVRQVVAHDNGTYTVILDCHYNDEVSIDH
ncbi:MULTISPECIES: hypothetical protein [Brevibacillus]|uniref:hypothetical protein n=1 Tax=Brevibacillus TaxID=55080 RepID=UPI000ED8C7DF|nr:MULTISPECIES: hypothetical protein [Brevibacillus]MDR4997878.1 hypothetical protein [Brevibacillus parabrevis]HBZ80929.1 hypothetical protein [Brevibacillus sp.]